MAVADALLIGQAAPEQSVSREPPGRPIFAFAVLVILALLCGPILSNPVAENAPRAHDGSISFAHWGTLNRPVELNGDWTFVWHGAQRAPDERGTMKVPGKWSGTLFHGRVLPASGHVTYELAICDLSPGTYALYVPDVYAASRIWIDGTAVASRGIVGNSPEDTVYVWRSQTVPIFATGKPIHLGIEMAAFHHRDNGLQDAPQIGLTGAMDESSILNWLRELIFCLSLMLLAIYAFVIFIFRPSDRASLYFGLAAFFLLPCIAVLGQDNLVMIAAPWLSFRWMSAIEYMSGALAIIFWVAYANALFPDESPRVLYYPIEALLCGVFLVLGYCFAMGDTIGASHVISYAVMWDGIAQAYMIAVITVAVIRGRSGALIFLLGISAFAFPLVGSILVQGGVLGKEHVIGTEFLTVGVLMLLYSHVVILAERWSTATRAAEEMTADLRRLIDVSSAITAEIHLETLLRKIVEATSKFLHADRSSLFLYNEKNGELTAFVAEGLETRQISFPATIGLAGHCFSTGEVINVEDAYKDPRFHRAVDTQTGYRTKSVLSMPVMARDGRRIGVMQALNRRDAKAFDKADIARMSAFASQAAIAIDNATLFSAVASERSYNESILRSMSNGVITFDTEMHVAKMNAAGAAILELDSETVVGASARQLLTGSNETLYDELAAVRADRQPRQLLDADIRTASGHAISANVTVVPLVGEGGVDTGLLVLFEDITEEKRMQGAMRRFMTQKVVDQVLQRQDELLFGTSCVASVLFADIRNFTTMAEALTARETVDMLNEIFTELVDAVAAADGVLDKFIGDAVMAVFGAPLPSGRDTANAVDCAVAMILALGRINARRQSRGQTELRLGIGVATGDVVAGTIGSQKRMDYTVIGDSVNLSSRLQALTKLYKVSILLSETTAGEVAETHVLRELDVIRVRGRKRPEKIFQLLSYHTEETFPHLKDVIAAYARGRDAIQTRNFAGAIDAFEEALRLNPNDQPSQLMIERAKVLLRRPPPQDWDGVWSTSDVLG